MDMKPVESSNIAAIGYESETLRVRFKDGKEYEYSCVTSEQHAELMAAESKGRWLSQFRRGKTVATHQESLQVPDKTVEQSIREERAEYDWSFAVVR